MSNIDPKPREIWLLDWDFDQIGAEITKCRPAIVIGKEVPFNKSMRIVVPLTSWDDKFKNMVWMFHLSSNTVKLLVNDSAVNTYQIKCYDIRRFQRKLVDKIDENDFQNTLFFTKRWLS
ncbi:MAG: type II toxin-antitoxin system PemK/MazF family toxin [Caldiserica bacterium]|nr:type II toxin-antitoxin system PemK/MazF family toxin [Caldisericota bacterium]